MNDGLQPSRSGNTARQGLLPLLVAAAYMLVAWLVLVFASPQYTTLLLVSTGVIALGAALLLGWPPAGANSVPPIVNASLRKRRNRFVATLLSLIIVNGVCMAFPTRTATIQLPLVFVLVASVFWQGSRMRRGD